MNIQCLVNIISSLILSVMKYFTMSSFLLCFIFIQDLTFLFQYFNTRVNFNTLKLCGQSHNLPWSLRHNSVFITFTFVTAVTLCLLNFSGKQTQVVLFTVTLHSYLFSFSLDSKWGILKTCTLAAWQKNTHLKKYSFCLLYKLVQRFA